MSESVVSMAPFVCKWRDAHNRPQRFDTQEELEHHVYNGFIQIKVSFQLLLEKKNRFLNFLNCSYAELFIKEAQFINVRGKVAKSN